MELRFCIQDPTDPDTTYLYEEILGAAVGAASWTGVYAFATRNGVDQLIEDQAIEDFMHSGGRIDLIVGIDAVTNRPTLERLQELEARHANFRPRVFWNETGGLFHPKISHFSYRDGRRTLICGSGNLTPNGLTHNFEGYTVITTAAGEELDLSSLNDFLTRQNANVRAIDIAALERAARNLARPIAGAIRPKPPQPARRARRVRPAAPVAIAPRFDRILIALVPGAGGRWSQVHFNAAVVEEYFRITDRTKQRVYLTQVDAAGNRGDVEVRPCIYSETNKNHKIEIRAAKGIPYPANAPPLLIFRERQVRSFDYMLLMPNQTGYTEMVQLAQGLPSVGRGLRRVVTTLRDLAAAWPECPLLSSDPDEEREV
jgi:hypothetical protein